MDYQEAVDYLYSLQMHKIKLGLEAMRGFLDRVGSPEQGLRCVHVAGTNGKGSVSATLVAILGRAGYRAGLYTSPHLSDVRERFRLGDRFIDRESFARLATRIREVLGPEQITFFDVLHRPGPAVVRRERGRRRRPRDRDGGRLDATNVVTPLVSIITSISMDHEAYLGTNLTEVAGERPASSRSGCR